MGKNIQALILMENAKEAEEKEKLTKKTINEEKARLRKEILEKRKEERELAKAERKRKTGELNRKKMERKELARLMKNSRDKAKRKIECDLEETVNTELSKECRKRGYEVEL